MSTVGPAAVARLAAGFAGGNGLARRTRARQRSPKPSRGRCRSSSAAPVPLVERWTPLLWALGTGRSTSARWGPAQRRSSSRTRRCSGTVGAAGRGACARRRARRWNRDAAFDVLSRTPLAAQAERRRGAIETGEYPGPASRSGSRARTRTCSWRPRQRGRRRAAARRGCPDVARRRRGRRPG